LKPETFTLRPGGLLFSRREIHPWWGGKHVGNRGEQLWRHSFQRHTPGRRNRRFGLQRHAEVRSL